MADETENDPGVTFDEYAPDHWSSPQINELAAALAKAQAAMSLAERSSENPFFHSSYADLASVWTAVRKPLSDNGLAVVQLTGNDPEVTRVTTILTHSSGQWIKSEIAMRPVKNDPQGMGSALTYARRYGLSAMCGVAPADDDGNAACQTTATTAKAAPAWKGREKISEAQVNRLWAIAKSKGRDKEDVIAYLKDKGYNATSEITRADYPDIMTWIETDVVI